LRQLHDPQFYQEPPNVSLHSDISGCSCHPRDSRFSRRCVELLSRARYLSKYKIADEELAWFVARVKARQDLVETICRERLSFSR
jgi:hypothetical protein